MIYTGKVGVVGVGTMGYAIAEKLAEEKMLSAVYDKNYKKELSGQYFQCKTIQQLVRKSGVVLLILPDDYAVTGVVNEICELKLKPQVIVNMSTISPQVSEENEQRVVSVGVEYIECPMIGGVRSIYDRKLKVIVGGSKEKVNFIEALLGKICEKIIFSTGRGGALRLKLLHNLVTVSNSAVFMSALKAAEKLNVNKKDFFEVVQSGTASSYVAHKTLNRTLLEDDFAEGFKLGLLQKDLKLIMELLGNIDMHKLPLFKATNKFYQTEKCEVDLLEMDYPIIYSKLEN